MQLEWHDIFVIGISQLRKRFQSCYISSGQYKTIKGQLRVTMEIVRFRIGNQVGIISSEGPPLDQR